MFYCPEAEGVGELSPRFQPIGADLMRGASMGEWFLSLRDKILSAPGEGVSKHRVPALGLFLGSLVLNDIPVLDQDSVFQADNIRCNPVDGQPDTRETAVEDDDVSLRYDDSRLILEGGRNALDQVEEPLTARFNVRTMLNVVGRPEALRCAIISLVEESVEGFQDNCLIVFCFCIVHGSFCLSTKL